MYMSEWESNPGCLVSQSLNHGGLALISATLLLWHDKYVQLVSI